MGLFSSSATTEQATKKIRPTVVKTQNVAKELMEIAKKNEVNPNSLDFDILEVKTYTRVNKEKMESDWEEIGAGELHELDDATAILNKNFQIKQAYEIEVYTKNENDIFKNFHAAVGANATKCKIYLSIKEGSEIATVPKFEDEFLRYINKSKIRAGIFVGMFDEMVFDVVSRASAMAKVDGIIKYDKNQTILIAEAYEPTPTINDALIKHYEKGNAPVQEHEKVDYSKRGFIHSVLEGETLLEYIKPRKGKAGRNCRGEFMEPTEPLVKYAPDFSVDETIEIVDNKENIIYRAKRSGYISFEAGKYQIKSDMDVGEISFKTTGSVLTGLGSDVSLSVKENDYQKDAIGAGMEVQVSEIDIKGNIGPNSKVYANRATVEGQTHKTSYIAANDLTINIHKGFATGDSIKINRLEHGVAEGKKVEVSQAMGGTIRAKDIEIEHCTSYVKATASRLIEIKKLQGSENIFTIDPLLQKEKNEDFDEKKHEIHQLEKSIDEIKKEIDRYKKMIKDNSNSFNEIKKRLIYFKQNNIKMPASFVDKYKQHIKAQEHLDGITKEYQTKSDKLTLLNAKATSLQDNIFDARIINRDRWVGHNELIFKLIEPPIEVSYKPYEGSVDKIFAIVKMDDGMFEIRAVKE
ncbi:MAG: FapA family protein [Sulfurimonas sp.]|uniref:flagellar assembly protein A n=1 Tax=Sulfurimonas sp. TaxID=2022749 RepID=UPI00260B6FB4|nr:flagellar assembly protein A [Sulfurimonas sp.]MDD2652274.1 FapA family protein [Sulfurimonas sp.]MDD3451557.1 FapA family protein [Sulfurimonas sp.]